MLSRNAHNLHDFALLVCRTEAVATCVHSFFVDMSPNVATAILLYIISSSKGFFVTRGALFVD